MRTKRTLRTHERGLTLLITLLLMGVLLGVSSSLINITLKQYQLSGIALSSEVAFQTANAGLECMLYQDFPQLGVSPFTVPSDGSEQPVRPQVTCMGQTAQAATVDTVDGPSADPGNGRMTSGEEQRFQFTWGNDPQNQMCSEVSVYKFSSASAPVPVVIGGKSYRSTDCPAGSVCTVVQARGYNVRCADISTSLRVVEREYTQVY